MWSEAQPLHPSVDHPFWVRHADAKDGAWVDAAKMQAGDLLLTAIAAEAAGAAADTPAAGAAQPTSVFWSGPGAESAANEWVAANGGQTLGMTQAGQDVAAATQGMDWEQAQPIWQAASKQFAANAWGDVQAFVSSGANPTSVFFTTELPTLLANPNVGTIFITIISAP
jgi:hypothetical protein